MPSLDAASRRALLGPLRGTRCDRCGAGQIRHYCRSCDEFFTQCACVGTDEERTHVAGGHRLYLWTPAGVMAIPDFDTFGEG